MTNWRTIGVLGGMGPAATADFMTRLVIAAGAERDTDHPRVLVDSNPHVPDRNAAQQGRGPSPGPALAAMARGLVAQGAEVLAMPCNAAHGWADDVRAATPAVFVDLIAAAVAAAITPAVTLAVTTAVTTAPRRIGLLAIGATLDAGLYQTALAAHGFTVIEPDRATFQSLVNAIKAGDTGPAIRAAMAAETARLVGEGADAIIAACTEVPLVLSAADISVPFTDATTALVSATLAAALRT